MYSGRISNCYDSHCHWLATGEMQLRLDLKPLKAATDVGQLQVRPHHHVGGWLIGFGYNETQWVKSPHRRDLDKVFPEVPVVFSRIDGHVYWVNSQVLQQVGLMNHKGELQSSVPTIEGGSIEVDSQGLPTGIFVDAAKKLIQPFIPQSNETETQSYLLAGMKLFHENGFTHIRDMSCSEQQWNETLKLEASGLLAMAVEQTFSADTADQFDSALDLAKRAIRVHLKNVRPQALKIYYDGALGSEGAYLSQPYGGKPNGHRGLRLLQPDQLEAQMRLAWELPLAVAVHTIGDQAAHEVVQVAVQLWNSGFEGTLHLEHAELLRPETIELMRGRPIVCHLQPCHWLTDREWIDQKLPTLKQNIFPWSRLQKNNIAFYFGSDTPISRPSVFDNFKALQESPNSGVPALAGDIDVYHSHPDPQWIPNSYTLIENDRIKQVVYNGVSVFEQGE